LINIYSLFAILPFCLWIIAYNGINIMWLAGSENYFIETIYS